MKPETQIKKLLEYIREHDMGKHTQDEDSKILILALRLYKKQIRKNWRPKQLWL